MDITATIFGQMIAFAFFIWFCMKKVWPPLTGALGERLKKIADGLEAADRAQRNLELAQERAAEQLREAKTQAAGIIDQANKRANQIIDEAKGHAREEGKRLIAGAQAELEQEINRAKEQLRSQVAAIAFAGAEKILEASVDEKAHSELAEKLAASL
ncbi:MAG: F0F1 ATP synthase subunit B [Pseudomonadales bacterium]|nr:F0F1 ATP synthase subunit B [Pseudomonadales bacterium]